MATMNISLPERMKAWAESQAEGGKYSNTSDYVRDLIRRDQERAEKIAAVQVKIDEGMASGISPYSVSEIFDRARAEKIAAMQAVVSNSLGGGISGRSMAEILEIAKEPGERPR